MQVRVVASHACDAQSLSRKHTAPSGQGEQIPPPQSGSVSKPSCSWSAHWSATQVEEMASQASETQSPSFQSIFFQWGTLGRPRRSRRPCKVH